MIVQIPAVNNFDRRIDFQPLPGLILQWAPHLRARLPGLFSLHRSSCLFLDELLWVARGREVLLDREHCLRRLVDRAQRLLRSSSQLIC